MGKNFLGKYLILNLRHVNLSYQIEYMFEVTIFQYIIWLHFLVHGVLVSEWRLGTDRGISNPRIWGKLYGVLKRRRL